MTDQNRSEEVVDDKLLVTFALFAYNQEQFIREAIEGAFSQTYSPLEIILSDDCSSDDTYKIMTEMAACYRGPHTVRVRVSPQNRGLAGHINDVMKEISKNFIVVAAGDDVSFPNRVVSIINAWQQAGRPIAVVYSDVMEIHSDGSRWKCSDNDSAAQSYISSLSGDSFCSFNGSSESFHPALFNIFGPIAPSVINEDATIRFRAELAGSVIHIPEILVKHRRHERNAGACGFVDEMDGTSWLLANRESFRRLRLLIQQHLDDFAIFIHVADRCDDHKDITQLLARQLLFAQAAEGLCNPCQTIKRFRHIPSYIRHAPRIVSYVFLIKLVFPNMYRALRNFFKNSGLLQKKT